MTGPEEPGDDWAFPEVASPTSFELPAEDTEQVYDTGSDAWWRQQAQAQRRAAQDEPPVPPTPADPLTPAAQVDPPELVEATALVTPPLPSPLDRDWLPPDLPELPATESAEPEAPETPEAIAPAAREVPETQETPEHAAPLTRPPHEGERVGPARAVAGALLAVAGVGLGIGALLLYSNDGAKQNGAVIEPRPTASAPATAAATSAPTLTGAPTGRPTASPTAVVVAPPVTPTTAAALMAPVEVLNNSRIKGLADRGAGRFRAGGWTVSGTGNYSGGTISQTTAYYAPGQLATAQRFAKQFGIPRVLPRFAGLPGSGLTVVLTRDFR